jgi:hypothetical protein
MHRSIKREIFKGYTCFKYVSVSLLLSNIEESRE